MTKIEAIIQPRQAGRIEIGPGRNRGGWMTVFEARGTWAPKKVIRKRIADGSTR